MAKQRNSLGVLVLPIIEGNITWDEYKARTGIDLNDVFVIRDIGGGQKELVFRDITKLILISYTGPGYGLPNVVVPKIISISASSEDPSELGIDFEYSESNGVFGYSMSVLGNKTIGGGTL